MWIVLALLACTGETKDSGGGSPPPINQDSDGPTTACEGAAPVITELLVMNGGMASFEDGDLPTVAVKATGEDEDRDLNQMAIAVWWDEVVDGAVDTSGPPPSESSPQLMDEEECETTSAILSLGIGVNGSDLEYDTLYEFAAVITDAHGLASEPAVKEGYTPTAEGGDGGA